MFIDRVETSYCRPAARAPPMVFVWKCACEAAAFPNIAFHELWLIEVEKDQDQKVEASHPHVSSTSLTTKQGTPSDGFEIAAGRDCILDGKMLVMRI